MSFYLSPPKGSISLKKLTEYVLTRLTFLFKILDANGNRMELQDIVEEMCTVQQSECLIEGSMKDKISHFVLRLACCQSAETELFFLNTESALFDWRFSCMSEQELCKLLKTLDPYLHSGSHSISPNNNMEPITDIFQEFSKIKHSCGKWRTVVKNYLNGETSKCFYVPFQNVLRLVQQREVCLTKGIASVPFCHLRTVVTLLYIRTLEFGLKEARLRVQTDDERLIDLMNTIKSLIGRRNRQKSISRSRYLHPVTNRDVDKLAVYFPLCMSHALWSLRQKHRLGHHTRLQLTLFLKELGLPIHEALIFWKDEYSKPSCNHGNGCSHDWLHNEGRYTYNIRHLYGLEGSRKNYKGHSCKYLQEEFQGHKEEGGCPFRHFDRDNLIKVMVREGFHGNHESVLRLAADGDFNAACQEFMYENVKKQSNGRQFHSSKSEADNDHVTEQLGEFCTACDKQDNKELSSFNSNTTDSIHGDATHITNARSKNSNTDSYNTVTGKSKVSCEDNQLEVTVETHETKALLTNHEDNHEDLTVRRQFDKPIDYYISYRALLEKLKCVN